MRKNSSKGLSDLGWCEALYVGRGVEALAFSRRSKMGQGANRADCTSASRGLGSLEPKPCCAYALRVVRYARRSRVFPRPRLLR